MSAPRPTWTAEPEAPPMPAGDWSVLPDDWRDLSFRVRYSGETTPEYANRVRAAVAEGLAPPSMVEFADWLDERV